MIDLPTNESRAGVTNYGLLTPCVGWDECFNPLSPHDALRHRFTSLKTDLIFQQPRVLK